MTDGSGAKSSGPGGADRAQQARDALALARAAAQARGNHPGRSGGTRVPGRAPQDPPGAGPAGSAGDSPGWSGGGSRTGSDGASGRRGRARREDPEPLHAAIDDLIRARGWREDAAGGSVAGRWAQIVGSDLAAHTRPDRLVDGELTVTADSTAWATQLRLLAAQLVRRLNAELGDGVVRQVRVRGPASAAGPARKPGQWRVRGGRGPRDTYG
jgi:predicted nucleic acid-binding Zn ribbon protein